MQYTTVGSNFSLPLRWRLLDGMLPIAALMSFAWSTGVLFMLAQEFQSTQLSAMQARQEARRARRRGPPMTVRQRLLQDDLRGVHHAVNIFVATTVLWIIVKVYGDSNPVWAISSMVATSDPQLRQSVTTFKGRLINTLVGCAIGLVFIVSRPYPMAAAGRAGVVGAGVVVRGASVHDVAAGADHRRDRGCRQPAAP